MVLSTLCWLFCSPLGEDVASALLRALITIATGLLISPNKGAGLAQLMTVLVDLAGAGTGVGHRDLMKAVIGWLQLWLVYMYRDKTTVVYSIIPTCIFKMIVLK